MSLGAAGLAIIGMMFGHSLQAAMPSLPQSQESEEKIKKASKADVEAALAYLKKRSPQVHEDALRVWKNFKSGLSEPHYTYRFWARDMILWLRKKRGLTFETQEKIGEIFKILHELVAISKDAVILLTTDVWSFLVYREGVPDLEQRMAPPQDRTIRNNYELDA